MRNLRKNILGLCLVGMGLGVGAPAQAATGVGPYYATPSWDQTFPAATRFIVLTNMNSEAVLDRETGLVWEKVPSTQNLPWVGASSHCIDRTVGGRRGWRLPTLQDLLSLIDPTQIDPPQMIAALPPGHPFTVQLSGFWTATSHPGDATVQWAFHLVGGVTAILRKSQQELPWCVRGGQGPDAQ